MDALYATLSLSRKTVVAGRYLFTLALNLCAVLFSIALAIIGTFVSRIFGLKIGTGEILLAGILLAAIFIAIQAIQLPFFFKLGYTKAKFFSMVPFVAIMSGYLVFMAAAKKSVVIIQVENVLNNMASGMLAGLAVSVILLVCFLSYGLSLSFYRKREF
jgi:hypothetical protein